VRNGKIENDEVLNNKSNLDKKFSERYLDLREEPVVAPGI
jgi:hypothetical protein